MGKRKPVENKGGTNVWCSPEFKEFAIDLSLTFPKTRRKRWPMSTRSALDLLLEDLRIIYREELSRKSTKKKRRY